jgi:MFS family permease
MARYARTQLGAPPATVGLIVGSSSIAAIVLRPYLGRFADRHGVRRAAIVGSSALLWGALTLLVARSIPIGTTGRALMGVSTALANTALTTWVIEVAPPAGAGRALGLFGLSIWVGLAAGPQVGQALLSAGGYDLLWIGCGAFGVAAACLLLVTDAPTRRAASRMAHRRWLGLLKAVCGPGVAAAIAFGGESVVLAFLAVHLESHGVPASGLTGAASVYSIFALSVVGGRLALVGLVDRVGPARAAFGAHLVVGAGLGVLALSHTFAAAAVGALLLGAGFSPLYPALVLLATRDLGSDEQATGVAVFGAFTDAGVAGGAALGGLIIAYSGTVAALAVMALAQLPAAAIIGARRAQRSSRRAGLETSIASSADSETPARASSGTMRRSKWS